ncbi:hypothetical protein D9M68_846100 [compost metagenome]
MISGSVIAVHFRGHVAENSDILALLACLAAYKSLDTQHNTLILDRLPGNTIIRGAYTAANFGVQMEDTMVSKS